MRNLPLEYNMDILRNEHCLELR